MGGEPKVDGRSTEELSNTNGRLVGGQPNTNRTPVGDQWKGIEHRWEGNGRKIGENVKKKEKTSEISPFFLNLVFIICALVDNDLVALSDIETCALGTAVETHALKIVPMFITVDADDSGTSDTCRIFDKSL